MIHNEFPFVGVERGKEFYDSEHCEEPDREKHPYDWVYL